MSSPDDSLGELLNWNNLTYKMPITNSVVSSRNLKKYPAERSSYSWGIDGKSRAGPMLFHLQAGEQYVDWSKSFLEFTFSGQLNIRDDTAGEDPGQNNYNRCLLHFGQGSACNFIDEVIVTTRSGVEIHRIESFHRWRALQDRMKRSDDWFQTVGDLMGYTSSKEWLEVQQRGMDAGGGVQFNNGYQTDVRTIELERIGFGSQYVNTYENDSDDPPVSKTFLIPLDMLGGPFATGQLSPAVLAQGMVIEIRLLPCLSAFSGNLLFELHSAGHQYDYIRGPLSRDLEASGDCRLERIAMHLDTHILNDSVSKKLISEASSQGLEIVYEQVFHQQMGVEQSFDLVCSKAVSRALRVFGGYYKAPSALLSNDICQLDKSASYYQWRLGSQYYPDTKIDSDIVQYYNLLYTLEYVDDDRKSTSLTFERFKKRFPIVCATFERSALLKYSGSAINNSRTLSLSASSSTSTATGQFHIWMEHLAVAKTFLNNCIVSI